MNESVNFFIQTYFTTHVLFRFDVQYIQTSYTIVMIKILKTG